MVLQTSGQIGFSNIQSEFTGTNPISFSEYYRQGAYVPDRSDTVNIPATGAVKLSDFYGMQRNLEVLYTWLQKSFLLANDAAIGDNFGYSLALSVDTSSLAVGAWNKGGKGTVYIFSSSDSGVTWALNTSLQATDALSGDMFGSSMDFSADGTFLLVGAPGRDYNGNANVGCAYVFTKYNNYWTQQVTIQPTDLNASAEFGSSVVLSKYKGRSALYSAVIGVSKHTHAGGTEAGSVYIYNLYAGTVSSTVKGVRKLIPSDAASCSRYGNSLSMSADGLTMVVGANAFDKVSPYATDAGAAYVYSYTNGGWTQVALLQASDAAAYDMFGTSVAISGDGQTIAVGSSKDDQSGGVDAGSVYIYTKQSAGTWTQTTRLQASSASANNEFGNSVSLSYDGTALAVGGHNATVSSKASAGAAYVFGYSNSTWTQQTFLTADSAKVGDEFGYSVSLSWDGTALIVGSPYDDSPTNAGMAFIFTKTGTTWTRLKIKPSSRTPNDNLGYSVAMAGNGKTAAIGMLYGDALAGNGGMVFIYVKGTTTWTQQAILTPSGLATNDLFGYSIALSSDGNVCMIGGVSDDNSGGTDAGSVYLFTRTGTLWKRSGRMQASDAAPYDSYGNAIAMSSDGTKIAVASVYDEVGQGGTANNGSIEVNDGLIYYVPMTAEFLQTLKASDAAAGDHFGNSIAIPYSFNTLMVGAYTDDVSGPITDAGSVYAFNYARKYNSTWTQGTRMNASDPVASGQFGNAVAMTPDGQTLVVGSYGTTTSQGSVYVFSKSYETWIQETFIQASDGASCDQFGYSVSISDDGKTIAIGAWLDDDNRDTDMGSVYIYTLQEEGWTYKQKIVAVDGITSDKFGCSVVLSGSGDTLAVGALLNDTAGADAGCVYVYNYTSNSTFQRITRLQASDPAASDFFGYTAAMNSAGDTLVIGAYGDDLVTPSTANAGSVYIFTQSGTSWSQLTRLQASDPGANDYFGLSMALNSAGDMLAVGAYADNLASPAATDAGSVYIFTKSGSTWAQLTRLQASDAVATDSFGYSLAMNASGDTLAIGAYGDDLITPSTLKAGSVYIFTRSGSTWTQHTRIQVSDPGVNDNFGRSVAISSVGDILAVGSPYDDLISPSVANAGSVYIFTNSGSVWAQLTRLQASDPTPYSDYFGNSLSMNSTGDILAIGSYSYSLTNPSLTFAGSVYLFTSSGGSWGQLTRLQASDPNQSDQLGFKISINYEGNILSAGANNYSSTNPTASNSGTVYVFKKSGSSWYQYTRLQASDAGATDTFGNDVVMNSTGSLIAIGAPNDSLTTPAVSKAGSMYIYDILSNGGFQLETKLYGSDTAAGNNFGNALALSTDGKRLAVGAAAYDFVSGMTTIADVGAVYVFDKLSSTNPWSQLTRLQASDPGASDNFGYSVAINSAGDILAVGSYMDDVASPAAADGGSVYIYTKSSSAWLQLTRLQASDPAASDYFGYTIAMNSVGDTLAVGAYYDDITGANDGGSVYIFTKSGSAWGQLTRLQASDPFLADYFGVSLALNSAGSTLAVGSYYDNLANPAVNDAGSVYIFTKTGSTWGQLTRLQASDAEPSILFGNAVAMSSSGDILAVASSFDNVPQGNKAGSVYIFTSSGSTWGQHTRLQSSEATSVIYFGNSITMNSAGDMLAVGIYYFSIPTSKCGAVNIFTRNGSTWGQVTRINQADAVSSDYFGTSVATNALGNLIAVGVNLDDIVTPSMADGGTVYIFSKYGSTWTQVTRVYAANLTNGENFGISVALNSVGDSLAIGAYLANVQSSATTVNNAGSAYIFKYTTNLTSDSSWAQTTILIPSDQSSQDGFGKAIGLSGDGKTLAVGSYLDDDGLANAGSVYVYTNNGYSWSYATKIRASDFSSCDQFGSSLAISQDGVTIAVGAQNKDTSTGADVGSVYIFDKSGTTWVQTTKLQASDPAISDFFGTALALTSEGETLIVGSYLDDLALTPSVTNGGSIYEFTCVQTLSVADTKFAQTTRIQASDASASAQFGSSVHISGDGKTVAIGAAPANNTLYGSSYIYTLSASDTWMQSTRLYASDRQVGDLFGTAVYLTYAGDVVGVGAPKHDNSNVSTVTDGGATYVFRYSSIPNMWYQDTLLKANDTTSYDQLGISAVMYPSGDYLVSGAYLRDGTATDAGAVYQFKYIG